MTKQSKLADAKRILSPPEYQKYKEWLEEPFAKRFPYLAQTLLTVSLATNAIFLISLLLDR